MCFTIKDHNNFSNEKCSPFRTVIKTIPDTCCRQVVYHDRADLWLCCRVQLTAFSLAESVFAGCVSALQSSHFTLNASWVAETSGNNPSNIFRPQPRGYNTTFTGVYFVFYFGSAVNGKWNSVYCKTREVSFL